MVITSTVAAWKLPTCPECDGVFHVRGNRSHGRQREWQPGPEAKVAGAQSSEARAAFAKDGTDL